MGLNAQAWGTEEVPANNESDETITCIIRQQP
jgi:hypothetical protein